MRRSLMLAALGMLALVSGLPAEEKPRPPAGKEEGFVSLFNGKDLDAWVVKGKAEGWEVKDGIIRSEGAKGGDWLRSKKEYADYVQSKEPKIKP